MLDAGPSEVAVGLLQPTRSSDTGPIVVLTGGGPLPWVVINAVVARHGPLTVLLEEPESTAAMFRRRLKRLGVVTVTGQIAFGLFQRVLRSVSRRRLDALIAAEQLQPDPNPRCPVVAIGSVNSDACRNALARLRPAVVLVIGTRMIGRATLATTSAPFVNYHAGVNPKYRGMCGGYWALASGDREHFGATVHLVDHGVDTGGVLAINSVKPSADDNFVTYPFRLAAAGRELVLRALDEVLAGRTEPTTVSLPSRQWYHPTLWGYLWTGMTKKVW